MIRYSTENFGLIFRKKKKKKLHRSLCAVFMGSMNNLRLTKNFINSLSEKWNQVEYLKYSNTTIKKTIE